MPASATLVWFRQDLRLGDNPALHAALSRGGPVLCLYVLDEDHLLGGASGWWLDGSLRALKERIEGLGGRLVLRRGESSSVVREIADEAGVDAVYWNRVYEPAAVRRDTGLKLALRQAGFDVRSYCGGLLVDPWEVRTQSSDPYKVFTPFWRALKERAPFSGPLGSPNDWPAPPKAWQKIGSDTLDDWCLTPSKPDWAEGLRDAWTPGESGAETRLNAFLEEAAGAYDSERNYPGRPSTSRLSPHLHWGELSPRFIWAATEQAADADPRAAKGIQAFLREVGWREFCHHLLYHWPSLAEENWKDQFDSFPWAENAEGLKAWQQGRTGYPIVDAGMRELWQTGWMHNRVRMIVASFLVKDLLIHWREGALWFEDTLVDADLANNRAGWQWVAGSGADAAPYFRIFNPVSQGEKFDPDGAYVRRYVPELAGLDDAHIHKPWEAPKKALEAAGIDLGTTYPRPIVDHGEARNRALAAYEKIKKG